jgi:hypothetical protein
LVGACDGCGFGTHSAPGEIVMVATGARKITELSDEDLERLLHLTAGADSVELKLTVPELEHRAATSALEIDPLEAQIRQAYFFDTPDLALNRHGIVARARRVQGRGDDSVVKLRPVEPDELPAKLRASKNMVVEVDAMPGGYVCSASLKEKLDRTAVKSVVSGERPLRKLFSKEQRAFFAAHAPDGVELEALSILGPITVFKLNFSPEDFGRKLVAELWMYPDYSRILELSTKCPPPEMLQVALESRLFLTKRGVDLSGEQQTKTRTALEFFTQRQEAGAEA